MGNPNILIPKIGVLRNELTHHLNAFGVIGDDQLHAGLSEQVFGAEKISIFADYNDGDTKEQGGSRAHHARAECAHKCELLPVASTSGITDAGDLGMRCGISVLDAQVVTARDHVSGAVGQHRSDRQAALLKSSSGLGYSFAEQ